MDARTEPVLYHKLQFWEPDMESEGGEEEEEDEEITLGLYPRRSQDAPGCHVLGSLLQ
uniref:Gamma-glutamyltransferase 6 n=1 Tax=Jaculus jaculus TaxID=51337 RepID=A0A8C5L7H1_JACJA